ncbi:MAG: ACT domain-containing protein, partial [Actinobacteria bacterium]
KETQGMISKKEMDKMKDGVIIVNDSRGGIINEKDLAVAVKSGKVAAAGLDVFEKEPSTDSPAIGVENIVVTPHLGASTTEAQDKAGVTIAEQVQAALKGDIVTNAVNIQVTVIEDAIKPYLPIAEKLGKLLYHLVEGQIVSINVKVAGEIADYNTDIITVAVLKGLFESVAHEPVTYVNAPLMAKDRGIDVDIAKTAKSTDYLNLINVTGKIDGKKISVSGTLVGKKNQERFVSIYDFDIDMVPSQYMTFFRYKDVPGMIGKVGTILGENNINIANMQVGRRTLGGEALMGINVDSHISEEILEKIKKESGIAEATFMEL